MRRWTYEAVVIISCCCRYRHTNTFGGNTNDIRNDDKKGGEKEEKKESILSTSSAAHSNNSSNMSDLLRMIAERKQPVRKAETKEKKPQKAVMAEYFTSAAATQRAKKQPRPQKHSAAKSENKCVDKSVPAVSLTLLEKLRRNVLKKRLNWEQMAAQNPLLQRLPVWRQQSTWSDRFALSSALPLTDNVSPTDIFVCSAPTGSGKSSLVPLFLLECHWKRLLQRIDASNAASGHHKGDCVSDVDKNVMPFNVSGSSREFVAEFAASSRVCIVVSQPTRLACVELAKFTASLLSTSSLSTSAGSSSQSMDIANVGGRVGYAVGGDVCFSAATEIIYATPGYIVNALQHKSGTLSPTTLIIDEAHCRDMETDLLLAWAKLQLQKNETRQVKLRQLVLMSATLPVEQMTAFFTSQLLNTKTEGFTGEEAAKTFTPHVLLLDGSAQQSLKESSDSTTTAIGMSTQPYRVEEYYVDDLPDALETSQVLHYVDKRNALTSNSSTPATSSSISSVCPLLEAPARRVMTSLGHFFSYTRFGADVNSPQARTLAQFLLFIVQSFATTPRPSRSVKHIPTGSSQAVETEESDKQQQPESILVFLPGFAEMSLVLQSLEVLCRAVTADEVEAALSTSPLQRINPYTHNSGNGASNVNSNHGNVTFLQYEQWRFSVALLHSTAIGSPQQQLHDSAGPFNHRIILATTVAESSVTIPNVRCVVDSCLERRFFTDPLTGVMLRSTAVASSSSLKQRGGRTGRTCDGIVIHLAPRRLFRQSVETNTAALREEESNELHTNIPAALCSLGRGTLSSFLAPAQTLPESLTTNAAAVLLRVKYLFPLKPSALVRNLPSPPSPEAITRGVEQLVELGLLQFSETNADNAVNSCNTHNKNVDKETMRKQQAETNADDLETVLSRYDCASLTAKGEFVAYLPLPHEQALLVYYALQFACVEEAILIACAMTVPSLIMAPRMTVHGNQSQETTPAQQYLQSLVTQRELAGVLRGGNNGTSSLSTYGEERSGGQLSEPLMLRSLLREWYACHTSSEVVALHAKYRVNRSAVRLVDSCVAQCAGRLYRLFAMDIPEDAAELHGEYDTAVRRPNTQAVEQLITSAFPPQYRSLLSTSLQRLQRCALEHATHRLSQRLCTMTHWYPHDDQLIQLLQPSAHSSGGRKRWRNGKRRNGHKMMFGTVQQRLSAAFVAAFARNTMRGEDGSHRVHHRRLVRNIGALQEDAENTCSFSIELQSQSQQQKPGSLSRATLHDRLTVEELQRVLSPYLAGTHLRQMDLFLSGRSAVACFGAENVNRHTPIEETQQQQQLMLLEPQVLPFERTAKSTSPAVSLAHIGISLLISIQNALTRLTVLLPPPPSTVPSINSSSSNGDSGDGDSNPKMKVSPAITNSIHRGIRFASENTKDETAPRNVRVTWHDSYGHTCSLLLSDVRRAGYEELFPTPSATPETTAMKINGGQSPSTTAEMSPSDSNSVQNEARHDETKDAEEIAMLSVHRVVYTRAVYWKVTLPTFRVAYKQSSSLEEAKTSSTKTPAPVMQSACHYCWVCHSAWMQRDAFLAHCRSVTHLTRLDFAVRHGMRRDCVEVFSSGTLSDLLLRQKERETGGMMGMELRHCNVSPTSFMNALQLQPRGDEAIATMPIAIAGSLVANTLSTSGLPFSGYGSNLQAMHIWVLDTDTEASSLPSNAIKNSHTVNSLPSSVFVLSGYLAAASSGFDVALLMNKDHSRAYAVMLYDWGVWRLPVPLTRTQLRSVLDVFAGKPWRGVPVTGDTAESDVDSNSASVSAEDNDIETGGMHWCVVSDVCPQCTYCGSGGDSAEKQTTLKRQHSSCYDDDMPSSTEVVESTLLIVLQEYQNSQRNVISFADYVQRVVAKLNAWSAAQEEEERQQQLTSKRMSITTRTKTAGVELLARFVARRHNQPLESLLRDIGCQFLTPPGSLLQTANKQTEVSTVLSNNTALNPTFSFSAMAVEGTTTEKLFLLPTVLPSFLPSPEFAALLRNQRRCMQQTIDSGMRANNAEDSVVSTSPPTKRQQPLF